jgi:hypothetical protein
MKKIKLMPGSPSVSVVLHQINHFWYLIDGLGGAQSKN